MAAKTIIKSNPKLFTMDAIYAIFSSAATALLFTAGWSIAVGRRLQTIDDLKSGFVRLEGDIKRLEEIMMKLVDRTSKLEGKVDEMASRISSVEVRMSSMETQMSSIETRISSIEVKMGVK
jgi:predicted nuclease with TOPRIM domain